MTWSIGVEQKHSRLMSISWLLSRAFLMANLIICMHSSAMQFDCTCLGDEMICSNSYDLANSLKRWELKCDTWSLICLVRAGEFPLFGDEGVFGIKFHNKEVVVSLQAENISDHDLPWSHWDFMWHEGLGTFGLLVFLTCGTLQYYLVDVAIYTTPKDAAFRSKFAFVTPLVTIMYFLHYFKFLWLEDQYPVTFKQYAILDRELVSKRPVRLNIF